LLARHRALPDLQGMKVGNNALSSGMRQPAFFLVVDVNVLVSSAPAFADLQGMKVGSNALSSGMRQPAFFLAGFVRAMRHPMRCYAAC
jgi:hypothetical protein